MIAYAWATDYIGIAGERTIYTILCSGSIWSDSTCTGKVVLGEHYRFRALKVHREVLYWKVGATEPAGKPTKCEVMNGRNWSCPGNDEASRAVALQMVRGEVVLKEYARAAGIRCIPKIRWLLAELGMPP
jgi:hypothetical protein